MTAQINKSMDREDLLSDSGREFTRQLEDLREELERKRLPVTSWFGGLPHPRPGLSSDGLKALGRRVLGREKRDGVVGERNRGGARYESLPDIRDDDRHPWFLYWEAYWVMQNGPKLGPGMRILDAGGTASLFSCLLSSTGAEVHSIDLNPALVAAGKTIGKAMGWNLRSYSMDMRQLEFDDGFFDHAYSICVFEHLDFELRRQALSEIRRCLKPGGMLCLTFDYRGPGVALAGRGYDRAPENLFPDPEAVHRNFDGIEGMEVVGNPRFIDNGQSYLLAPDPGNEPYTFGAMFLRRTVD